MQGVVFPRSMFACLGLAAAMFTGAGCAETGKLPEARPNIVGGCGFDHFMDGYYLSGGRKIFDDERYGALAPRLNVPVYLDAEGAARSDRTLKFSERVRIIDPGEGKDRLKVADSKGTIGWIARDDLFCAAYPSTNSNGRYRRVFIGAEAGRDGNGQPRRAYQTPEPLPPEQRCDGGHCPEVGEGQNYFIYAVERNHYLIGADAILGSSTARLLGWLPKDDGYVWDTGVGLRPSNESPDDGSSGSFICAYATEDDLAGGGNCIKIASGRRWFGLTVRLAVLRKTARAYEVVYPAAAAKADPGDGSPQGIVHAFVPVDDKVTPELLLSRDALDRLVKVTTPRDAKAATVRFAMSNLRLFLWQEGLDNEVARSRLMQFRADEFTDAAKMPACQIDGLAQYVRKKHDALSIVYMNSGKAMPVFAESAFPASVCPPFAEDRTIPFIDGDVRPLSLNKPGEKSNYSVMHSRGNDSFYWIPVDLLP